MFSECRERTIDISGDEDERRPSLTWDAKQPVGLSRLGYPLLAARLPESSLSQSTQGLDCHHAREGRFPVPADAMRLNIIKGRSQRIDLMKFR